MYYSRVKCSSQEHYIRTSVYGYVVYVYMYTGCSVSIPCLSVVGPQVSSQRPHCGSEMHCMSRVPGEETGEEGAEERRERKGECRREERK